MVQFFISAIKWLLVCCAELETLSIKHFKLNACCTDKLAVTHNHTCSLCYDAITDIDKGNR